MRWFRFILAVSLIISMVLAGALLAVQNPQTVPLDLLFVILPPRSVAIWILFALLAGVLFGMLLSSIISLRLRAKLLSNRRKLDIMQAEINQLRRSGFANDE